MYMKNLINSIKILTDLSQFSIIINRYLSFDKEESNKEKKELIQNW